MRVLFFSKCSKIEVKFKNDAKNLQKGFCFLGNCIWISSFKLSLLRREYLSSIVNVLTNRPKILHTTKRDFLQLHFLSQWSINMIKVLLSRFQHSLGPFTMLLVEGSNKRGFLQMTLTTSSVVRISETT